MKFSSISPKGPCSEDEVLTRRSVKFVSRTREKFIARRKSTERGGRFIAAASHSSPPSADDSPCGLYKVFSRSALTQDDLTTLFASPRVVDSTPWLAYPKFNPPETFAPFVLAPGLFYSNALENAASAMEVRLGW